MARRKVCPAPGCPAIIPTTATGCSTHARPTFTQRYTTLGRTASQHTAESRAWKRKVAAGEPVTCWRCREPITDPLDLDLGHDDYDRSIVRGPEHASCNRSAAGKSSHRSI